MKEISTIENTIIDKTITKKQSKYIDIFMDTNNMTQAYKEAGFKYVLPQYILDTPPGKKRNQREQEYICSRAKEIHALPQVQKELAKRLEIRRLEGSARAGEVMFFLSEVMRGHIKDQFGLDAPLSERTRAAVELAKRTIDLQNKLEGKENAPNIQISLNWNRENQ